MEILGKIQVGQVLWIHIFIAIQTKLSLQFLNSCTILYEF
jgi:hypothetical protein